MTRRPNDFKIVSEYNHEEEPHHNYETPERQTKQSKMIAKLERTQSNEQQNIEQLQNPTMGVTINNNRTTALEQTAAKSTEGLNAFYGYQILALGPAVVEAQKMVSSHGGFLTIVLYHHRETI